MDGWMEGRKSMTKEVDVRYLNRSEVYIKIHISLSPFCVAFSVHFGVHPFQRSSHIFYTTAVVVTYGAIGHSDSLSPRQIGKALSKHLYCTATSTHNTHPSHPYLLIAQPHCIPLARQTTSQLLHVDGALITHRQLVGNI